MTYYLDIVDVGDDLTLMTRRTFRFWLRMKMARINAIRRHPLKLVVSYKADEPMVWSGDQ